MIVNRQRRVRVARRPLERFLERVKQELGIEDLDVAICLVSDAEIARMNEAFREKKGPTDVLSFPAQRKWRGTGGERQKGRSSERGRAGSAARVREGTRVYRATAEGAKKQRRRGDRHAEREHLGDIAIAPETARRYAKKSGRSLSSELRVLILHGVLHLLGYDHETDHGEMNRIENKMRRRFGLA
jgi:probable rRNA maturation factor